MASYSRMLDMGGAPSAMNNKGGSINASKNCKVQAVCFDFGTLTGSISEKEKEQLLLRKETLATTQKETALSSITPNVGKITQIAEILNVQLGGEKLSKHSTTATTTFKEEEDLSRLMEEEAPHPNNMKKKAVETNPLLRFDVRSKYADKLAQKGVGLSGLEHAKQQLEQEMMTNPRGDAAGHLAARKMAISDPSAGDKWMALTGTGTLLQYLTQRSMKICLLPSSKTLNASKKTEEGDRMEQMKSQLNDVTFHSLIKSGTDTEHVLQTAMRELDLDSPLRILVVSDRDEYIRAAKERGLVTCRISPRNARRGNVSAHYSVPSVPDVKDVVDEINGISFNAVLKGR